MIKFNPVVGTDEERCVSVTHKGTICIIDDDDDVRASSRLFLEALGFTVEDFANAESFLKRPPQRQAADCFILDYHLTGMSGLDLLELLRERGDKTPAIIMTANGKHLALRAGRAGVIAILRKPLAAESLSHWLERIFAGKK